MHVLSPGAARESISRFKIPGLPARGYILLPLRGFSQERTCSAPERQETLDLDSKSPGYPDRGYILLPLRGFSQERREQFH